MNMIFTPMLIFKFLLMLSIFLCFSSNSILIMWISLEINMLSFLPLLSFNSMKMMDVSMKYFLIQAIASSLFLMSSIFMFFMIFYLSNMLMFMSMCIKLGVVPFHGWFISIFKSINIYLMFFLSSIQKIIPLMILISMNMINIWLYLMIFFNSMFIIFMMNNNFLFSSILAFSSINNLSWMLIGLMMNYMTMLIYMLIYMFLLMGFFMYFYKEYIYMIQMKNLSFYDKFFMIFLFMSLGGMPPLLGFLGKLMLLKLSMNFLNIFFLFIIMVSSLIIFIMYLYLSFSILLLNPSNNIFYYNFNKMSWYKMIYSMNMLGFMLIIYLFI